MAPRTLGLVATLALAACSDPASSAYTVSITGAETYLAAQDGDGPWQRVAVAADGTASFAVTAGFHGVAALCGDDLVTASFGAGAATWTACDPPRTTVSVSGALVPGTATAWVGDFATSLPGRYEAAVAPGRHDLVATAGDRIAIVRDQQLDADRTIDLDVDRDGVALVPVTPTIRGQGADPTERFAELHTQHGTYVMTSRDGFALVPAAQRAAGDRVVIGAQRETAGRAETVQRLVTGDAAPDLVFEPLPALTVDRAGLRASADWEFIRASYFLAGDPSRVRTSMLVTPAWLTASGRDVAPLVDAAALPGFTAPGTLTANDQVRIFANAGIGDFDGDYRSAGVDATLTW